MSDAPAASGGPEQPSIPGPAGPSDSPNAGRPPRRRRRWLTMLIALVLILLGLVLLLPTIVSSGPGTGLVLSMVDGAIPGSVKVSDLSVGWVNGAHVSGLDLLDPAGQAVVHLDTLHAPGLSLLGMLRNSQNLGTIDLRGLRGRIVQDATGVTNLDKALGLDKPQPPQEPSKEPMAVPRVRLTVHDAELSFEASDMPPAQVKNFTLDLDALSAAQIKADLGAVLAYDGQTGKVSVQGTIDDALDAQGQLARSVAKPHLTAELTDVPVGALDQIAGGGGKLLALLGPVLKGRAEVTGTLADLRAVLEARSEHLQAHLSAQMTPEALTISQDSKVTLTLAPRAWATLTANPQTSQPVAELLKPFELSLVIDHGQIPRNDQGVRGVRADQAKLRATLMMSDVLLRWADARLGETSVAGTQVAMEVDGATKTLHAVLSAKTQQSGQAGQIDARVRVAPADADSQSWSLDVEAKAMGLPVALVDQTVGMSNLLLELLGANADVSCNLHGDFRPPAGRRDMTAAAVIIVLTQPGFADNAGFLDRLTTMFSPKVQIQADLASLKLPQPWRLAAIADDKTISFQPGPVGTVVLSQSLLVSLGERYPALAAYAPLVDTQQPPHLSLSVQKLQAPIKTFSLDTLEAAATLSLDRLALRGDPRFDGILLSDVNLVARTDPAGRTLVSDLTAQLGYAGQTAKITSQSTASLDKLPTLEGVQSTVRVEGLPVALVDQLAGSFGTTPGQSGRYASLIGPSLDRLQWTTQYLGADGGVEVQLALEAPRLTTLVSAQWLPGRSIGFVGSDNRLVLKLTPESFAAWQGPSGGQSDAASAWQLVEPVDVSVTIPQARVGFRPSADPAQAGAPGNGMDLSTVKVNLQASVPTLSLRRGDGTPLAVEGLSAAVTADDPRKLIRVALQGQVVGIDASTRTRTSNPLRSDTQLTGLIDGQGKIDLAHAVIVTDTAVEQLPTSLLVGTLGLDPAYVQTLGPWVSLTAKGRYPGDVDVLLRSPNIDAPTALTIGADRTLHLRSDAVFSVVLTEQLGDSLLKYGSPLLVGVRSSDQPIKLTLKKDTLSLPLAQWDLSKLALDAKLELGTLALSRSWAQRDWEKALNLLATTLGVVTQSAMPQSPDQTTTRGITNMAFGPLEASLRNGVVSTNDLWMSDQLNALGVKGRVNLIDHTFDASMGLLGESLLRRVPALRQLGMVDAAAVYQFPVRGSIESPQVDMGPFVKQIAQAAIKQQAAGQLLGQLGGDARLGAAAGLLDAFLSKTTSGEADVASAWPNRPTMPALPESTQQPAPAEQTQQPAEEPQQPPQPSPIEGLLQQLLQQPAKPSEPAKPAS